MPLSARSLRPALRRFLVLAALLAPAALAACGDDDPVNPTSAQVAGSYQATTMTATEGGQTFNLLSFGATLSLTLNANGTATGNLHIPDLDGTGETNETFTGTWTLSGRTVTLSSPGDTFVEDLRLTANGRTLTATDTYEGATVNVVLTKQ